MSLLAKISQLGDLLVEHRNVLSELEKLTDRYARRRSAATVPSDSQLGTEASNKVIYWLYASFDINNCDYSGKLNVQCVDFYGQGQTCQRSRRMMK